MAIILSPALTMVTKLLTLENWLRPSLQEMFEEDLDTKGLFSSSFFWLISPLK